MEIIEVVEILVLKEIVVDILEKNEEVVVVEDFQEVVEFGLLSLFEVVIEQVFIVEFDFVVDEKEEVFELVLVL